MFDLLYKEKEITPRMLQHMIIENRKKKGFTSAADLTKTTLGLAEEVGEFERARRDQDDDKMIDALCDIAIYCLGAAEILDRNLMEDVVKTMDENIERDTQIPH